MNFHFESDEYVYYRMIRGYSAEEKVFGHPLPSFSFAVVPRLKFQVHQTGAIVLKRSISVKKMFAPLIIF